MLWSSGDYQIAPIAARSTAMGRWRLTPPGYGGICLPAGRSVRGSDTPPACHSTPRTPQGEGLRGASFNGAKPSRGRLGGGGGRSEKRLPWLGQAAASASAPVNVHAVLLTDNGDERLCPREYAGNCCRARRAEEVQKRSFCRCFWLLLSPQTKVARAGARNYPRRRQRKRSRRGAK